MFKGNAITVTLLESGIAEMNFDLQDESVNKFNSLTVSELEQALEALDDSDDVKGLLLTSAKSV